MKITDKGKWNLFLRRSRPPWIQTAQPTPVQTVSVMQQAPLGQHQPPMKTAMQTGLTWRQCPQCTARARTQPSPLHLRATHAPASASQPTTRQSGDQLKHPELKWVKTRQGLREIYKCTSGHIAGDYQNLNANPEMSKFRNHPCSQLHWLSGAIKNKGSTNSNLSILDGSL
ncbi:Forkhead box protein K2 [Myotis davidii]|uniref:Forkhead box protein K2 n=1 Tax=Myotis davidii TaxID=225400 RepID=L5MD21_MYODS|nr:Forkhead box protein K2 [Myotis davidii]